MSKNLYDLRQDLLDSVSFIEKFNFYYCRNIDEPTTNKKCPDCGSNALQIDYKHSYCHSCKTNKNVYSLLEEFEHMTFWPALHYVAHEVGAITTEDYEMFKKKSSNKNHKQNDYNIKVREEKIKKMQEEAERKRKEKPTVQLQSKEIMSNILNLIQETFEINKVKNTKLLNVLRFDRNLSDDRIKSDYFDLSFNKTYFVEQIKRGIKEKFGYDEDVLIGIPGFYKENGQIKFVYCNGLGMITRNADGTANGIHVRAFDEIINNKMHLAEYRKDRNGELVKNAKYFWASSQNYAYGCSGGAPVDVMHPMDLSTVSKTLYITEGKFKSEIIRVKKNAFSISVQGVNNWRNRMREQIDYICKNFVKIERIVICFDSDMATNFKVFGQSKSMIEEELEGFDCKIAVWDCDYGKGIDDLIINNQLSKAVTIPFKLYDDIYTAFLEKLFVKYPTTIDDKKNGIEIDKKTKKIVGIKYNSLIIRNDDNSEISNEAIFKQYKDTVLKTLEKFLKREIIKRDKCVEEAL